MSPELSVTTNGRGRQSLGQHAEHFGQDFFAEGKGQSSLEEPLRSLWGITQHGPCSNICQPCLAGTAPAAGSSMFPKMSRWVLVLGTCENILS